MSEMTGSESEVTGSEPEVTGSEPPPSETPSETAAASGWSPEAMTTHRRVGHVTAQ